jgi:hypothetical protein
VIFFLDLNLDGTDFFGKGGLRTNVNAFSYLSAMLITVFFLFNFLGLRFFLWWCLKNDFCDETKKTFSRELL